MRRNRARRYTYRSFCLRVPGLSLFTRDATPRSDQSGPPTLDFYFNPITPSSGCPRGCSTLIFLQCRRFLLKSPYSDPSALHVCYSTCLKVHRLLSCNTKMVYSLTYRRPASSKGSVISEKPSSYDGSIDSGSTGSVSRGIPDALSFNRIIDGGTCPVSFRSAFTLQVTIVNTA